ncbi:Hypothetical protein R9X50_00392400 [Acrodontium crateriforme]|uniref:HhH-GPD domain-containing protein n=1 Tax=Acrodontium crateriforme TaxID=150365 RepID=A0AAQ3M4C5_9PEZI|nr:Hypothetical protein R9X50_00392400 [Acrodontium crateriforme]
MSLRRSSRVPAKTTNELPNGTKDAVATPGKKRGRQNKAAEQVTDDQNDSSAMVLKAMPPPLTPKKRRKIATGESNPPPITPTPSAIGLMVESTDVKAEHTDRPAEPHHTNATLVTPRGTQVAPTPLDFWGSPSKPAQLATTATCLLDDACAHLIKTDPKLKPVIEKNHCKVFSPEGLAEVVDPFNALVSGILAQQVSGAAAKSIKNKFIALFNNEQCPNGFPLPTFVAKTKLETLRSAGLSTRKAEYVQGLAEKFDNGDLTVQMLMNGTDEEVMEKLVAVRGLGVWSVQMFMCFGLKRMDIFATGDLGVQRGMAAYMGRDVAKLKSKGGSNKWKYMAEKEMVEISDKFAPYRSLFMWLMWRIEDVDTDALEMTK